MSVLPTCMCVDYVHSWCPQTTEEGRRPPATGVKNCCVLPCRCWELSLCPLLEQSVLLRTQPSLQMLSSSEYTHTYI